jgi:hypothetical protein
MRMANKATKRVLRLRIEEYFLISFGIGYI